MSEHAVIADVGRPPILRAFREAAREISGYRWLWRPSAYPRDQGKGF